MLAFDPRDPFPLLPEGACTHAEAQAHAEAVDHWLGLETETIERELACARARGAASTYDTPSPGERPLSQEPWIGLPVRSLMTPYTEIRRLLKELSPPPGSTLVDLGAAYGRMGFVVGRHYPEVDFVGYELVPERVLEAQRRLAPFHFARVRMLKADLADPALRPVAASYYFLYDFGARAVIEKTLHDIRAIARERTITVVGRGRSSRDAIERNHPWLSSVVAPVHGAHYSIYRSG